GGRIASLYDTIGYLDRSRAAFALGLWIPDEKQRIDRFNALAAAMTSPFAEWHAADQPFSRPAHDLVAMLSRVQTTDDGTPGFPASRAFWAAVFDERSPAVSAAGEEKLDAAWLAEATLAGNGRLRAQRLDQFAFGQRVFANVDAAAVPDVLVALRALPRFRMLMLTLSFRCGRLRDAHRSRVLGRARLPDRL